MLHYDLGRGLRAFAGRDEQRLKDMVALANRKVGDLSALPKDPATAFAAARPLRAQQHHGGRGATGVSVALIIDQASYVFPAASPAG